MPDVDGRDRSLGEHADRDIVVDVGQAFAPLGDRKGARQHADLGDGDAALDHVGVDRLGVLRQRQVEAAAGVAEGVCDALAALGIDARAEELLEVRVQLHLGQCAVASADGVGDPGHGQRRPEVEQESQPLEERQGPTLELAL